MDGTILVADDDRTIRTVLTQALTRAGCKRAVSGEKTGFSYSDAINLEALNKLSMVNAFYCSSQINSLSLLT